jgi:hypothetical protein
MVVGETAWCLREGGLLPPSKSMLGRTDIQHLMREMRRFDWFSGSFVGLHIKDDDYMPSKAFTHMHHCNTISA